MDFLSAAVLSGIVYDFVKMEVKVTTKILQHKLANWMLGDDVIEKLAVEVNKLELNPEMEAADVTATIESSSSLTSLLKSLKPDNNAQTIVNQTHSGSGNNIGIINK
jgi:hypothetical protein